jgi:hypothetical protein
VARQKNKKRPPHWRTTALILHTIVLTCRESAAAEFVQLASAPGEGRLNIVFAAQPAKTADRNTQGPTGVLVAFIDSGHPFDLVPAKPLFHCDILRFAVNNSISPTARGMPSFYKTHNSIINNNIN